VVAVWIVAVVADIAAINRAEVVADIRELSC
jgi:hypothetical protein